jgi:hypothetical protein
MPTPQEEMKKQLEAAQKFAQQIVFLPLMPIIQLTNQMKKK